MNNKSNLIIPAVAFAISTSALSGNMLNISVNTSDAETENVEVTPPKFCAITNIRRRDITTLFGEFQFYETDSTSSPVSIELAGSEATSSNSLVQERIYELSSINYGWDGYGGLPPTLQVINNTSQFLQSLPEKFVTSLDEDNIYPNPNGTITIQWHNDGDKVSIEIGNTTAAFFSFINSEYDMEEKMSTENLSDKFISALNGLITS